MSHERSNFAEAETLGTVEGRRRRRLRYTRFPAARYHLTGAGLSPAGSRQLRLTHRNRWFESCSLQQRVSNERCRSGESSTNLKAKSPRTPWRAGDTARATTSDEVKDLRCEAPGASPRWGRWTTYSLCGEPPMPQRGSSTWSGRASMSASCSFPVALLVTDCARHRRLPMDKITGLDTRFRHLRAVSITGVM